MTPRAVVALIELLEDLLEWLEATDPGSLDNALIARACEVATQAGFQLVREGAQ